jgi:hypothetical protein
MKIYEVRFGGGESSFFSSKKKAIEDAKWWVENGNTEVDVAEHEIGRFNKNLACRLVNGVGWSESHIVIWSAGK